MRIEEIAYNGPLYAEMVQRREDWLRKPLGFVLSEEDLAYSEKEIHIAAVDNDTVVGVLVMRPLSDTRMKMRQVAVEPSLTGKGIGRQLVEYAEALVREKKYTVMELNARETAVPFYLRLGYTIVSDLFEEMTIPHYTMEKQFV